jgi:hypothetical protein
MISHNTYLNCMNARPYYHDFLSEETRRCIPESALEHMTECLDCRAEISRLKALLADADETTRSEQSRRDSAISTVLRLHFACIGEPVKCKTVKPFLASLADPVLQIRISTPITMHLDECQNCCNDVLNLRDLHLTHKQLCRLGQLLADGRTEDAVSCSQAQAAIGTVASLVFRETNAEILKHLCTCPDCREQLYLRREAVHKKLLRDGMSQNEFPCEKVSATDIYDYCLPYGIDPADDQYIEFRESLASHLRGCPTCLARMQELHRTIYNIAERAESDVVTIYDIDESADARSLSESGELYADLRISVETAACEDRVDVEQPATTVDFTAGLKQKVSAWNVKPLLKTGLAAAAVILIGLALLLNTPAAKAVTFEQIYRAVGNIKNVYVATLGRDGAVPIQERWVSRTLSICMSKTRERSVLLDIPNKVRRVKYLDTGSVETVPLSDEMIAETERTISGTLGLLPFERISDLPENGQWSRLDGDASEAIAKDTEVDVYDLTWQEYRGSVTFKWRFLVEPKTSLPQRTEFYQKLPDDSEYTLISAMDVGYLTESEIKARIKNASF